MHTCMPKSHVDRQIVAKIAVPELVPGLLPKSLSGCQASSPDRLPNGLPNRPLKLVLENRERFLSLEGRNLLVVCPVIAIAKDRHATRQGCQLNGICFPNLWGFSTSIAPLNYKKETGPGVCIVIRYLPIPRPLFIYLPKARSCQLYLWG